MNKTFSIMLLLFCFIITNKAFASETKRYGVFKLGDFIPQDSTNNYKNCLNAGLAQIRESKNYLLEFSSTSAICTPEESIKDGYSYNTLKFSGYRLTYAAKLTKGQSISSFPYMGVGIGYYSITGYKSKSLVGVNTLIGYKYNNLGAEIRYNFLSGTIGLKPLEINLGIGFKVDSF